MFNEITRGAITPGLARVGEAGPGDPKMQPASPVCSAVLHG